ncbi:unnamed protein product [Microthlaspi erraticum]|uniref:Uncharacterized protein n=1 Tax=Microthlaspi erraticum TaxID=1685480 RepID=A0A6D2K3T3_9BRAS|nr:unnamed protein product [Microthlaspi erraticum]
MDFIKTSSLRALIELTFQRNWNGLIWMSRKGVITKRVETVQTALSREQRPNRAVRLAEEHMFALGQSSSVRLKSRPKSKPLGRSRITTRETSPRSATPHATPPRTTKAREPGKASRPRNRSRTGRCSVRAGKERPASGREFHRPNLSVDHAADRESVRPRPFRLGHNPIVRPIVPHDRPNAAVDPKPFLKPKLMFSSPA